MESIGENAFDYRLFSNIKFTRQNKVTFLSAVIFGLMAHIYQITNMLSNDDTITSYYMGVPEGLKALLGGASSGRWLLHSAERIISWFNTPVTSGVVALLILSCAAVIVASVFDVQSTIGAVLVGGLITAFPGTVAYFSLYSVAYPLSVLLSVIAVRLVNQGKKGLLLSVLFLWLGMSIFPLSISVYFTIVIMQVLLLLLSKKESNNDVLRLCIKYVAVLVGAGIALLIATKFIMSFFNFEASGYQGGNQAISLGFFASIPQNIKAVITKVYYLCYDKMYLLPSLKVFLAIVYGMEALAVVYLLVANRIYKNAMRSCLIVLDILCLPFALCTMTLISSGFSYAMQHRMAWAFLFVFLIPLSETVLHSTFYKNNVLKKAGRYFYKIAYLSLGVIVYGYFLFCNICYFNQQYVMQKDQALAIRILSALEQTDGFTYEKPVYFLTIPTHGDGVMGTSPLLLDVELYKNVFPDTETNLWCYGDSSFKAHIKFLEGIEFEPLPGWAPEQIEQSDMRKRYDALKINDFAITTYADTEIYVVVVRTLIPLSILYSG